MWSRLTSSHLMNLYPSTKFIGTVIGFNCMACPAPLALAIVADAATVAADDY